jgi:hypothetical protein
MLESKRPFLSGPCSLPDIVVPLSVPSAPRHAGLPPLDLPPRPAHADAKRALERCNLTLNPEIVLTDMLQECHYIMREVALRSGMQSGDVQDRLDFIRSAMHCAETGASVAKAMAKLRALPMDEDRADAVSVEFAKLAAENDQTAKQ